MPRAKGTDETTEGLVRVRQDEIAIGEPLEWPVYDAHRRLLLNRGVVVASEFQRRALMAKGLYREGRGRKPRRTSYLFSESSESEGEQTSVLEGPQTELPFDQILLFPGDPMQLQLLQERDAKRYAVRLVGVMKPKSVLVTSPMIEERVIGIRDGQMTLIRSFWGTNVCAFRARVLKAHMSPFPYLHLSYPETVQAMRIRKAMRAPVDIDIAFHEHEGGPETAWGRILDLSEGGARVRSPKALGEPGSQIQVTFELRLEDIIETVSVRAHIRSCSPEKDEEGQPAYSIGLELDELPRTQRLALMNLVYRRLLPSA